MRISANHDTNLNSNLAIAKMGEASLRIDCPRNSKGECEPPIQISWDTPYSSNQPLCTDYLEPEYGDDSDFEDAGDYAGVVAPVAGASFDYEEIFYSWRYKGEAIPAKDLDSPGDDLFSAAPCEVVDIPAAKTFVVKYMHCKEESGTTFCAPEKSKEIVVAPYDPKTVNDKARPSKANGLVYFRTGVKFKGASGNYMFPAYKFNTTGFIKAVKLALNADRKKCPPGGTDCPEEYAEIQETRIRVLNVDDQNNRKDVLYEVRVPTQDGVAVQNRLLHPYFRFPLSITLAKMGLIPPYVYETQIEIDASKAVLLQPKETWKKKLPVSAAMAAGVIVIIVLAGLAVIGGAIYVAKEANKNKKIKQHLDAKGEDLNAKDRELQAQQKELEKKEAQLSQQIKALEQKVILQQQAQKKLDSEIASTDAEKAAMEASLKSAEASGDTEKVEAMKINMNDITARMRHLNKKKQDGEDEVRRIQAEQDRVRKTLEDDVRKQKEEHKRQLQARLAQRKRNRAATVSPAEEQA
jgi:hypothetical protein